MDMENLLDEYKRLAENTRKLHNKMFKTKFLRDAAEGHPALLMDILELRLQPTHNAGRHLTRYFPQRNWLEWQKL